MNDDGMIDAIPWEPKSIAWISAEDVRALSDEDRGVRLLKVMREFSEAPPGSVYVVVLDNGNRIVMLRPADGAGLEWPNPVNIPNESRLVCPDCDGIRMGANLVLFDERWVPCTNRFHLRGADT